MLSSFYQLYVLFLFLVIFCRLFLPNKFIELFCHTITLSKPNPTNANIICSTPIPLILCISLPISSIVPVNGNLWDGLLLLLSDNWRNVKARILNSWVFLFSLLAWSFNDFILLSKKWRGPLSYANQPSAYLAIRVNVFVLKWNIRNLILVFWPTNA